MHTTKINISLPVEVEEKLTRFVEKGKKSAFIVECIKARLDLIEQEKLREVLKEGYSQKFPELEDWNSCIGDGLHGN